MSCNNLGEYLSPEKAKHSGKTDAL